MDYRDKILALAGSQPLLPSAVAKALSTTSIMAGAMLSEMVSKGMLKTSALRVGGSPLYLIPGNESQLLSFVQSLNEKDRRTVSFLQESKLVRESEVDPLTRVSLSHIKDFAKPLVVAYDDKEENFYKWFELSDEQAEVLIGQKLGVSKEPVSDEKKEAKNVKEDEEVKSGAESDKKEDVKNSQVEAVLPRSEVSDSSIVAAKEKEDSSFNENSKEVVPSKKESDSESPSGTFWERVHRFFADNNITLVQSSVVKKRLEFDLIVDIPSPVGSLSYYCKARSKKRVSDGDLSAAYVQGQIKKLPVIYLTDGDLSKQANIVLSQLKGIAVKKV